MRYTTTDRPRAMTMLTQKDLHVAVERTNELLERGFREPLAIAMGIAWAKRHRDGTARVAQGIGPDYHVRFEGDVWTVTSEEQEESIAAFKAREDALARAGRAAYDNNGAVYGYSSDGILVEVLESYDSDLKVANTFHVVPSEDGWAIKATSSNAGFKRYDVKREAVAAARAQAKEAGGRLVIHYADGDVQKTYEYQRDTAQ